MNIISTFLINHIHRTNILDTGDIVPSTANESYFSDKFGMGEFISRSSISAGDGSNSTSIFSDSMYGGVGSKANVSVVADNGFGYAIDSFIGGDVNISGNGFISVNGYARIKKSNAGVLYFSLSPSTQDVSGTLQIMEYTNGTMMYISGGSIYRAWFIYVNSVLYFASMTNDFNVGYFNEDSTVYMAGVKPKLIRYKLYIATAGSYTLNGTVKDFYGQIMPDVDVLVYNKTTNTMIGKGGTDSNGDYSISVYGKSGDICYMVLLSPPDVDFQSKVIDTVILQ